MTALSPPPRKPAGPSGGSSQPHEAPGQAWGGVAARMLDAERLHLQHGPIDLIVTAEGPNREAALAAALARTGTILKELMGEWDAIRDPACPAPRGETARRMAEACRPFPGLTPMAAVAGAVAETVLAAMLEAAPALRRAAVNNGGDIALHLAPGEATSVEVATPVPSPSGSTRGSIPHGFVDARVKPEHDDSRRPTFTIDAASPVRGVATSGQGGRSLSLGIADAVTVLAATASQADAAATHLANAVDLPGHSAIRRAPADAIKDDADLGAAPVVTAVGPLSQAEVAAALDRGAASAQAARARGLVEAAAFFLRGQARVVP